MNYLIQYLEDDEPTEVDADLVHAGVALINETLAIIENTLGGDVRMTVEILLRDQLNEAQQTTIN